ncbi:MAG TPA: AAA family ATPase [Fimbriimonadales bacterium]|nr:AAA family ATPase [Fimbriimonadales bacterium]
MAITKLCVHNFKSFADLELDMERPITVLIGANASGKSNVLSAFQFLRDIRRFGLRDAISIQGGIEFLRNIHLASTEDFSMRVTAKPNKPQTRVRMRTRSVHATYHTLEYEFVISFHGYRSGYKIIKDSISAHCDFILRSGEMYKGILEISRFDNKVKTNLTPAPELEQHTDALRYIRNYLLETLYIPFPRKSLLLESFIPNFFFGPDFDAFFDQLKSFDFDPKKSKKASHVVGRATLNEDGSNLSVILHRIFSSRREKAKFSKYLSYLLPFVKGLRVSSFPDKSLLLVMKEKYYENRFLPGFALSDGTLSAVCLITALFFDESSTLLIEEPDRNIHPSLIGKLHKLFQEASEFKQILITTHNPLSLRQVELRDIRLISRDANGLSRISRPSENEEVKEFLKNDIGIDEIFVNNLFQDE